MAPLRCSSGHGFPADETTFRGFQEVIDGDWILVYNCPTCHTTVAGEELHDACKCAECDDLIIEGVKTCVERDDGPFVVFCGDCADEAVPPRKPSSWMMRHFGIDVGM
jgi:hypothetical protein